MKTQHTPAPWFVYDIDGAKVISDKEKSSLFGRIVNLAVVLPNADIQFNARLIAAAPDLLAACEEAASFLTIWGYEPKNDYEKALKKMLDATIKKARG